MTADAWNGVPPNPERDGWHWCQMTEKVAAPIYWNTHQWWDIDAWGGAPRAYLGPCLTPAEVAAAVLAERAACAAVADALRAILEWVDARPHPHPYDTWQAGKAALQAHAARPAPAGADALAAALAQARREGIEACIAEHVASAARHAGDTFMVTYEEGWAKALRHKLLPAPDAALAADFTRWHGGKGDGE